MILPVGETFCCMICRLLQDRSPACVECGAATMVSLERGAEALKFGNLQLSNTPTTRKEKLANAAGTIGIVAGYAGILAGAALWWPAIPLILGGGATGIGIAAWKARDVDIAQVELLPPAAGPSGIERRGVARKLSDSVKSVLDGSAVLVEEIVIRTQGGGVLMRRVNAAPFVIDAEGERLVVAGAVRITSKPARQKLRRADPIAAALGIPHAVPVAGVLETARLRDGDRVRVTGTTSIEMVPELAFHRDAGETIVMRGSPGAVVTIAVEDGGAS